MNLDSELDELDKYLEAEFQRAHDFEGTERKCCVSPCGRDEIDQDRYKKPYCWEHLIKAIPKEGNE